RSCARDVLRAHGAGLSQSARGLPPALPGTASRRGIVRGAQQRAADRVPETGRSHSVLRARAAADAGRHVRDAEVRRQPRRHRLEPDGLPGPAHLHAAFRLLRPGLSRLQDRSRIEVMTKTYRLSETVDFAIVGSGAAGGVIARELAQAGFAVVVFEQGPRHTLADFQHDELKNWFSSGLINDVVKNPQTFRDDHSKRGERNLVRPNLYYARTVGGSSTHYTANY